jgi:hypothetical protein
VGNRDKILERNEKYFRPKKFEQTDPVDHQLGCEMQQMICLTELGWRGIENEKWGLGNSII